MNKMGVLKCCENTELDSKVNESDYDTTDKPPNSYHVTKFTLVTFMCSIVVHCIDVGFDIYVAYSYFATGRNSYAAWSVACILIPSIILALMSIRMYDEDLYKERVKHKGSVVRIVLCISGIIIQSAPLIRNCDTLYFAIRALRAELKSHTAEQKKYFNKMLNEDSDTAFLRIFETYLEAAPQQVLQMTLLLTDYSHGSYVHSNRQMGSIFIGFLSMAWAMANYKRCVRFEQNCKLNITHGGLLVQFLWNLCFTVSRILPIAALGSLYPLWACIAIMIHWLVMSIWLAVSSKTNFCDQKIFEVCFSFVIGAVYIFTFLNVEDGPTKKYYMCYFLLIFVENTIMTTIWGLKSSFRNWVYYIFVIFPFVFFILSVFFIIVYYKFLHPTKVKSDIENDTDDFCNNAQDQRLPLSE